MNALASKLADQIAAAEEPFAVEDDSLLVAHEIIAKVRMPGFKPCDRLVEIGHFGSDDVDALRDALLTYSRTYSEHPSRGLAYWGLGELRDRKERELLRELLNFESSKENIDEDVLWQIRIGLDNIGEGILDP